MQTHRHLCILFCIFAGVFLIFSKISYAGENNFEKLRQEYVLVQAWKKAHDYDKEDGASLKLLAEKREKLIVRTRRNRLQGESAHGSASQCY